MKKTKAIAALKYEYKSKSKDIDSWELYYDNKSYFGKGLKELKELVSTLPQTVVYAKGVKLLYIVNKNDLNFNFTDGFLKSMGFNNYDFFSLISDNIEFREWNNWFKDCEDCKEFIENL